MNGYFKIIECRWDFETKHLCFALLVRSANISITVFAVNQK